MSISLISSWKESLQIFKPSNFKPLLLLTFKGMGTFYKAFLLYGWPILMFNLLLIVGFVFVVANMVSSPGVAWLSLPLNIAMKVVMTLYVIFVCLAARASVKKKDCAYFRDYYLSYRYWPIYIGITVCFMLSDGNNLFDFIVSLLVYLFLFFSFDGSFDLIKDMTNALKMFFYNLPIWIGLFIINTILSLGFILINLFIIFGKNWVFVSHNPERPMIAALLIMVSLYVYLVQLPFIINLTRVFYTKRLYDQFSLYFPDKSK